MTDSHLEIFLGVCRQHDGGEPDERLRQATSELLSRAEEDGALLVAAASALSSLAPAAASWLAITLGAAVERGGDSGQTAPAVLDLLRSWLPRLPTLGPDENENEEDRPEPTPEQATLLDALPLLCQSAVAHLARTPTLRAELAQDEQLLERLEELEAFSHGALWLSELLRRASGPLIVLHSHSGAGFRLRYENVASCFHLFSLIQTALGDRVAGGRAPDPAIVEAARGRSNEQLSDEAWWHYGDPRSSTADIGASIWGEAMVRSIPYVDEVQVVLLWPPLLGSRSWDSGFFGPALEAAAPDVVVEQELSPEACRALFIQLGVERGGPEHT